MQRSFLISLILFAFLPACQPDHPNEVYYPFRDQVWQRFNILSFELPVESSETPYRVLFFARHTREFPYQSLDFQMILRTPSGEERIREFQLSVRDSKEKFLGDWDGEQCEVSIILNRELVINKSGLLVIELENLIPRIETPGLLGVGIRLEQD